MTDSVVDPDYDLLDSARLNPSQREAVEVVDGPLLVLAGAGSGKTRVLTYRIAHLILSGRALPGEVFAVTFTNKAAKEMAHRVNTILAPYGVPVGDLWISTFHSTGARFLRKHGDRVGLEPGFTILDDSDQLTLVKQVMDAAGISDKILSPKQVQHRINELKNDAVDPAEHKPYAKSFAEQKMVPLLKAYEDGLRKNNSVDFGDLLFKTFKLLRDNEDIRRMYQERYRYLLVDEYQDTNAVQYAFLELLAHKHKNLCVVGDEDQCIYKWRGADIRNILDFEKDFAGAKIVKLEQNYRSTGHIIRAANGVIANNSQRKEKQLFTDNPDGQPVEVHIVEGDLDEARWVGNAIRRELDLRYTPKDIAIFYRTNAQSRLFEDVLRMNRINYRVFGGLKFYDRAEIKDSLAYLRLFVNARDDISLGRIINVPTRGIGKTTIDVLREFGRREGCSLLEAAGRAVRGETELGNGPRKKIEAFLQIFAKLDAQRSKLSPRDFYALMLDETGYLKALKDEGTIEAQTRFENLEELGTALTEYEGRAEEPTLENFLEEVALVTDADKADANEEAVTLMTVHSAKGLEYPVVFLAGMEEELFPSSRATEANGGDKESIEEERRLCYVGMTRAREKLFMTSSKMRRVFGVTHVRRRSRFIDEIPGIEMTLEDHAPNTVSARPRVFNRDNDDFGDAYENTSSKSNSWAGSGGSYNNVRSIGYAARPPSDDFGGAFESAPAADGYIVGSMVKHPDFGEGNIVRREGSGDSLKVSVAFERWGTKKFLVKYAPFEKT